MTFWPTGTYFSGIEMNGKDGGVKLESPDSCPLGIRVHIILRTNRNIESTDSIKNYGSDVTDTAIGNSINDDLRLWGDLAVWPCDIRPPIDSAFTWSINKTVPIADGVGECKGRGFDDHCFRVFSFFSLRQNKNWAFTVRKYQNIAGSVHEKTSWVHNVWYFCGPEEFHRLVQGRNVVKEMQSEEYLQQQSLQHFVISLHFFIHRKYYLKFAGVQKSLKVKTHVVIENPNVSQLLYFLSKSYYNELFSRQFNYRSVSKLWTNIWLDSADSYFLLSENLLFQLNKNLLPGL